ncbi:hypothetical protein D3C75_741430 [compost metagenome]
MGICLHIYAIHQHLPLRGIIKPGDQIHHRAFSASRGANKSYRFPLAGSKADIADHIFLRIRILEAHVPKFNLTMQVCRRSGHGAVYNSRLGLQHLQNPLSGNGSTGKHDKNHDQHHKGHNNLHGIGGVHDHIGKQNQLILHV